jgi:hypothetical protein
MGCDIHIMVESLEASWRATAKLVKDDDWLSVEDEIYDGRNYKLFSILANVRNGYGFAGCDTGDTLVPISMPKGVPDDGSSEYKMLVEQWGCDGHSHSYLTLQELLNYDWTQTATLRGWVDMKEYLRFKLDKKPESWSGGISGGSIKHLTNQEMENEILKIGKLDWSTYHKLPSQLMSNNYTQVEWKIPYYDAAGTFFGTVIPKLLRFNKDYNKTRIVFFFDN